MISEKNRILLQIGNFSFAFLTVIVNALANIIPIGGNLTGDIADSVPNLFVPTGLTFAIWGVIYVLIILFGFYQFKDIFKKEKENKSYVEKIGAFFILASIGNITWIFLWHNEQIILSMLPMILLFFSLLMIYQRLEIGKTKIQLKEKIFYHLPFSVYFGWITVATVANITAVLVKINWNGFNISADIWTILIISIVVFLTILILIKRNDFAYSIVIIWALFGIYLKRMTDDANFGIRENIAYTSLIGILIIVITAIIIILYNKKLILKE